MAAILAFLTNLAEWKPAQSPRQKQPKLVDFLEQVICQLVSPSGRDWQYKFKAHKHIGLTILIKVQRIISKLALAAGDPDVGELKFDEGPMSYDTSLDLQLASHLMTHFVTDLNRAIVHQELDRFMEVPPLYTKLYPPMAPSNRGPERGKGNDININDHNDGGSGGGSGGSNKKGDDNRNSSANGGNLHHTENEGPNKDQGIFIVYKFPYFKCGKNPDGVNQPPKITVNGKEVTVCLKGSSKGKVCIKNNYGFAHLFLLDKCTKGVNKLNTWITDTNGVKFSTQKIAAAAVKAKLVVLNKDPGKKEE